MNFIKSFCLSCKDLVRKRGTIFDLARQDFHNRCLGATLGFVWTLLQPMALVLILWFVFGVAMGAREIRGSPFGAYVLAGMAAWSFFSEALLTGTNALTEYSFIVKKVPFRLSMLPVVKLLSSLAVHVIFLALAIIALLCLRAPVTLFWLQIPYYLAGLFLLLLGLCWLTSALVVFLRDIGYLIGILLQFGFWLTPIVWDLDMLPARYARSVAILKLNPVYYIVEGYRQSLLGGRWFWEAPRAALLFWLITAFFLVAGGLIFQRAKPHFADML